MSEWPRNPIASPKPSRSIPTVSVPGAGESLAVSDSGVAGSCANARLGAAQRVIVAITVARARRMRNPLVLSAVTSATQADRRAVRCASERSCFRLVTRFRALHADRASYLPDRIVSRQYSRVAILVDRLEIASSSCPPCEDDHAGR